TTATMPALQKMDLQGKRSVNKSAKVVLVLLGGCAVILRLKLIRSGMQLVAEIVQDVGDPFVARLFGQLVAFLRLGAEVIGKISHSLIPHPEGTGLHCRSQGRHWRSCSNPQRTPKNWAPAPA